MSDTEFKTYQGNCHCGAVKFRVKLPELKSATACNCSICFRKSYLWIFPGAGKLEFERGEDVLTVYEFASKFCPHCGTGVMAVGKGVGINVRTLMGVDPFELEIKQYDGWNIYQPHYVPPKFTGKLPRFVGEGLKVYTGSCHCGSVTLAVKTKPFPEVEVKEDNCSICQRNGYVVAYPTLSQVSIIGEEHSQGYTFDRKFTVHHFCKTCGIPVYMRIRGPSKEILDAWPKTRKEMVRKNLELVPVNLKAINDVEWDDLKIKRSKEGVVGYVID